MKKKLSLLLLLVVGMLLVTSCVAAAAGNRSEIPSETPSEASVQVELPSAETVLSALLARADAIAADQNTVFDGDTVYYTEEGEQKTLSMAPFSERTELSYRIFLSLLQEEHGKELAEYDYTYDMSFNRMKIFYFVFLPDYAEKGYDSALSYWKDIREHSVQPDQPCYLIDYMLHPMIRVLHEEENLYETLRAAGKTA